MTDQFARGTSATTAPSAMQVTVTQPMLPFCSEDAVDKHLEEDDSAPIDQFVATIERLNVILSRHALAVTANGSNDYGASDDPLESLFAIEQSVDDADDPPSALGDEAAAGAEVDCDNAQAGIEGGVESPEDDLTLQLNNLVFLGYMSAVESYFRCLTRRLILVDEFTSDSVEDVKISFGAARHSEPHLLPEVLLEDMTFVTLDQVKDLLVKLIGVEFNPVADLIREYDRICQLRHCIVHRFGRLGSKNAMKLGFRTHRHLLERKVKIQSNQLETLAFNLLNFVKGMNDHIFVGVLSRSAKLSLDWQWSYDLDREKFESLYEVFRKGSTPNPSVESNDAYAAFMANCQKGSATQVQRAKLGSRSQR